MSKVVLIIFGFCIAGISMCIGIDLLKQKQLSGGQFVSFVVAYSIIGLVVSFASEIKEFSIAGNIVKLKDAKDEAERFIESLKKSRVENFRFLLKLVTQNSDGYFVSESTIDSRVSDFWSLYKHIVESGCQAELKENVKETTDMLLRAQLTCISEYSDDVKNHIKESVLITPEELIVKAFDEESIDKKMEGRTPRPNVGIIKKGLAEGVEEYRRLYALNQEITKA